MSEKKATLLIVEDDPPQRVATQVRLKRKIMGTIDTAENGRVGLQKLEEKPYGFVLMDLGLPDMDGEDVVEIFRRNHPDNTTPIIALTAQVLDEAGKKDLMALGFNGYLKKPLKWDVLKALLDELDCTHLCIEDSIKNTNAKGPGVM